MKQKGAAENAIIFGITLVSAAGGITVAAFSTFETQSHSQEMRDSIEHRLERIENKLDSILGRENSSR